MADSELLKIAADYDSLVEPAQDALRSEFARRKMEPPLAEDPAEITSERLVTLRSYPDISQAMVPKSVLDSAGIFSFLRDENVVRVDWGAGIALGGVRLQVRPEDVQEATDLLSQPMPASIDYEASESFVQPHCPRCGSTNVSAPHPSTPSVALQRGEDSWQCDACGHLWADDGNDVLA
jgi:hypothetical protein